MKIIDLLVVTAGLYVIGFCYHCELDVQTYSSTVAYDIDTKPHLTGENKYWISNMQFFVFGQIEEPASAVITAGFYDKDDTSKLVYGLTVDCGSGTWQTNYIDGTTNQPAVWKSGTLDKACEENEYFDITYELQQRLRGKFIFNSQPMEHTLMWKGSRGVQRIERLPIALTNGTHFKAEITEGGGKFERYAYGKCVAYPDYLRSNCTESVIWGQRRSKGTGEVAITINNILYSTGYMHIGEFGAWTIGNSLDCWSQAPQFFSVVQPYVHADENSQNKPYCCCSYMNGTLDEASCASWADLGGGCTYTCTNHVDQVVYDAVMAQAEQKAFAAANDTFSNVVG